MRWKHEDLRETLKYDMSQRADVTHAARTDLDRLRNAWTMFTQAYRETLSNISYKLLFLLRRSWVLLKRQFKTSTMDESAPFRVRHRVIVRNNTSTC